MMREQGYLVGLDPWGLLLGLAGFGLVFAVLERLQPARRVHKICAVCRMDQLGFDHRDIARQQGVGGRLGRAARRARHHEDGDAECEDPAAGEDPHP